MQLLATGRDADVYALSADTVLRRYRQAGRSSEREAEVMRYARRQGLPVPEVHDAQGPDLVMERLVGPTMAAAMLRRPWTLRPMARLLAEVHRTVHAVAAPEGMPRAGEGTALLHLDLHPENVVLTPDGPRVIDWTNAAVGPAALDVADVWLLMSSVQLARGRLVSGVGERLARRFAHAFVAASAEDHRAQLPAAAARRLADRNLSQVERDRMARLVR